MPDPDGRRLDPIAVQAALRRLRRIGATPWLHQEVARRMAERLAIVKLQPERIVDWWSTLGAGAAALDAAYPRAERVAIEPDAEWARLAASPAPGWWQRLRGARSPPTLAEADATPATAGNAQLVWANMMLHAVVDPPALFNRWHDLLRADGFVMFSCLGPGTLRGLRSLYERLGWPAPTPGFVDMQDLGDMLVAAGFADPVMDQEILTLTYPDADALLAELRTLGGNTAPDRHPGLRTPRWRDRLRQALEALRSGDAPLTLEFEVAYGHAFRGAPRVRPGEATTVSLEDMRSMVKQGRPGAVR